MPTGCDFICDNNECKQYKSGFVINSPWPLGKIELVLNSSPIKKVPELRERLIQQKNEGRKFACIQFPNNDQIPILAYRISLWSPEAKCIWQYDIELDGKKLEDILMDHNYPSKCEKTNCDLLSFNQVVKKGIECPFCNVIMKQNRWYANEK